MNISAGELAALVGLTVFVLSAAAWNLVTALRQREELVTRAEDIAADPAVLSDPLRRRSFLVRWADRYDRSPAAAAVREQLRRAHLPWKPSDYRIYRYALGGFTLIILWQVFNLPLAPSVLAALAALFVVPKLVFAARRNAYVQALEGQLVEITQLMANALRAGMSVQQAIGQVAERVPEPAKGEFRQTHNEMLLGDSLAQALSGLSRRVRSRDLDVVVSAIVVQHAAGGNLARVLAAMANMLTERQRLASEIRSLTAEARFSALIIMLIPIVLLLMLRDTPLGETLFGSLIGWALLAAFIVVQVLVYLLIQKIATIEV
jgi:tight adherence protein B